MSIDLLHGAFVASQDEKGKWIYKANIEKIGKKPKKESMKEQPQYKQIEEIEKAAVAMYQEQNGKMVIEIAKYLNTLI